MINALASEVLDRWTTATGLAPGVGKAVRGEVLDAGQAGDPALAGATRQLAGGETGSVVSQARTVSALCADCRKCATHNAMQPWFQRHLGHTSATDQGAGGTQRLRAPERIAIHWWPVSKAGAGEYERLKPSLHTSRS